MKRLFFISSILILLISCTGKQDSKVDTRYNDEFYSVLNELIRLRYSDVSIIKCETKPVYKTMWGNVSMPKEWTDAPPPPPAGFVYYDISTFDSHVEQKHLDSIDAKYMYSSIDSSFILRIDSSRVSLPVISEKKFREIFRVKDLQDGYDLIRKTYGTSCFIIVSAPVFNSTYTKVFISIDSGCGPLNGGGTEFLLEKKNGRWLIISAGETWVS